MSASTVPASRPRAGRAPATPIQPAHATHVRGQIFSAGMAFAFAAAALLGGLKMVFGTDVLVAAGYGMVAFLLIGTLGWVVEVALAPSLERVAAERELERAGKRKADERDTADRAAAAARGAGLDVTLPQETAMPVPLTPAAGSPATPAPSTSAIVKAGAGQPAEDFQELAALFRVADGNAAGDKAA
jgi:hypothetical protein